MFFLSYICFYLVNASSYVCILKYNRFDLVKIDRYCIFVLCFLSSIFDCRYRSSQCSWIESDDNDEKKRNDSEGSQVGPFPLYLSLCLREKNICLSSVVLSAGTPH